MLRRVNHPRRGEMRVFASPLHLADSPDPQLDPAPGLGEHTRSVLKERLGLTDPQLDELSAQGAI
jgi:crotonobetainyl-CoA:carnitine CoA-transferase CaiB-like acyl-CoA transferase